MSKLVKLKQIKNNLNNKEIYNFCELLQKKYQKNAMQANNEIAKFVKKILDSFVHYSRKHPGRISTNIREGYWDFEGFFWR